MEKGEGELQVAFVCVRAAHYRHMAASPCFCDVGGWRGYCPAGDVGGHDWMSTSIDLATLRRLGYYSASDADDEAERESDDATVLIGG